MPYINAFVPQQPVQTLPGSAPATVSAGVNYADLRAKQVLAEALRKRANAGADYTQAPTTVSTNASGAYPGFTDVNWGGIVQNAMQPWVQNAQEKKAANAEAESAAAQDEALQGVDWNALDPAKALQLQRLGIDPTAMAKFAEKDSLGQYGNLVSSIPGIRLLMLKNKISPEHGAQMIADIEAGKKPELTFDQQMQLKIAGRSPGNSTTVINSGNNEDAFGKEWSKKLAADFTTAREAYQLAGKGVAAGELYQNWAADPNNFTTAQQLVKLGSAAGLQPADAFLTPSTRTAMAAAAEDVRNSLKALGGSDSNTDLIWATKALPTGAFTMDQAQAMSKYYAEQAKLTQAALQAQMDYYAIPENRTANKPPPDFYGQAKKSMGASLEAAKAQVEAANKVSSGSKAPINAGSAPP